MHLGSSCLRFYNIEISFSTFQFNYYLTKPHRMVWSTLRIDLFSLSIWGSPKKPYQWTVLHRLTKEAWKSSTNQKWLIPSTWSSLYFAVSSKQSRSTWLVDPPLWEYTGLTSVTHSGDKWQTSYRCLVAKPCCISWMTPQFRVDVHRRSTDVTREHLPII